MKSSDLEKLFKRIEIHHKDGSYQYPSLMDSGKQLSKQFNGLNITYFDVSLFLFHKITVGAIRTLTPEKNYDYEIAKIMIITYDLEVRSFDTIEQFKEFIRIQPNIESVESILI